MLPSTRSQSLNTEEPDHDCSFHTVTALLVAVGIIFMIGGAIMTWQLHRQVGAYAFFSLLSEPLGIAFIVAAIYWKMLDKIPFDEGDVSSDSEIELHNIRKYQDPQSLPRMQSSLPTI